MLHLKSGQKTDFEWSHDYSNLRHLIVQYSDEFRFWVSGIWMITVFTFLNSQSNATGTEKKLSWMKTISIENFKYWCILPQEITLQKMWCIFISRLRLSNYFLHLDFLHVRQGNLFHPERWKILLVPSTN